VAQFSIEAQWQSQAERRRRIVKFMLLVVLIFILLLIGLWFWLTQPMLTRAKPSLERTVDPHQAMGGGLTTRLRHLRSAIPASSRRAGKRDRWRHGGVQIASHRIGPACLEQGPDKGAKR